MLILTWCAFTILNDVSFLWLFTQILFYCVGLMWIFGAMQEYVGRLPKPTPIANSQPSIKTRKLEKKKAERVTKMKNTKR